MHWQEAAALSQEQARRHQPLNLCVLADRRRHHSHRPERPARVARGDGRALTAPQALHTHTKAPQSKITGRLTRLPRLPRRRLPPSPLRWTNTASESLGNASLRGGAAAAAAAIRISASCRSMARVRTMGRGRTPSHRLRLNRSPHNRLAACGACWTRLIAKADVAETLMEQESQQPPPLRLGRWTSQGNLPRHRR